MKILITGGAGFIGTNSAHYFSGLGHDVVVIDNLYLGDASRLPKNVKFVQGDSANPHDLGKCGDSFDIVIALAGTSSAPMFTNMSDAKRKSLGFGNMSQLAWAYQNSVTSFIETLEFAKKTGVKKVLYASTSSLYGNNPLPLLENQKVTPPNHYAVTKFCYEHIAACFARVHADLDIVGFRFMSVYGDYEEPKGQYANMISQFIWDIARGLSPVIYGDGNQFRDFTHVHDVIQALDLTINHPTRLGADVFNIGRGESTSFNEIFEQINAQYNNGVEPIYIPNPVKEGYVKGQHADISKIQAVLGYAPKVDLQKGINSLVKNLNLDKIKGTSSDTLR